MSEFESRENAGEESFDYSSFNKGLSDFVKFAIEDGIDISDDEIPAEGKKGQSLGETLDIVVKALRINKKLLEQSAQEAIEGGDIEEGEIFLRQANKLKNILNRAEDSNQE